MDQELPSNAKWDQKQQGNTMGFIGNWAQILSLTLCAEETTPELKLVVFTQIQVIKSSPQLLPHNVCLYNIYFLKNGFVNYVRCA